MTYFLGLVGSRVVFFHDDCEAIDRELDWRRIERVVTVVAEPVTGPVPFSQTWYGVIHETLLVAAGNSFDVNYYIERFPERKLFLISIPHERRVAL